MLCLICIFFPAITWFAIYGCLLLGYLILCYGRYLFIKCFDWSYLNLKEQFTTLWLKLEQKKTISIEKSFVPGKWLSSLSRSISFTLPWRLIIFLYFSIFFVVNECRFDKIDGIFIACLTTTWSFFITQTNFQIWIHLLIQNGG